MQKNLKLDLKQKVTDEFFDKFLYREDAIYWKFNKDVTPQKIFEYIQEKINEVFEIIKKIK